MKTKEFTAREIARILNVPLDTAKRWARTFLPPDPTAGRQAGRARIFSLNDYLILFLARYLIRNEGYNISDSCQILQDMLPWLSSINLLPSKLGSGNQEDSKFYELFVQKKTKENFFRYDVKKVIHKYRQEENGKDNIFENYTLEGIKGHERLSGPENTKVLRISLLLKIFLSNLGYRDDH